MSLVFHDEKLWQTQHEAFEAVHSATKLTVIDCQPTGSAYYGKPDPADYDCVMLIAIREGHGDLFDLSEELHKLGWLDCSFEGNTSGGDADDDLYGEQWIAARKGHMNAIITEDPAFYYRHFAASTMVRSIAIKRGEAPPKSEVIKLFQWVRDGKLTELAPDEGSN